MEPDNNIRIIRRLYSIRDSKLQQYGNITPFENDSVAVRAFGDLITRDKENIISVHRDDFALWFVGTFDVESGVLSQSDVPYVIAQGSDFADKSVSNG